MKPVDPEDMHRNTRRVVDAAAAAGLDIEPVQFDEHTRTADDAARAIGVSVGQIVKSLVFLVDGDPVLALVSGDKMLDEEKLAVAARGDHVARADANQVREATGYPVGGVAPFGHATPLSIYVDRTLLDHDVLWAAAGTPNCNFALSPSDLLAGTAGALADLARE